MILISFERVISLVNTTQVCQHRDSQHRLKHSGLIALQSPVPRILHGVSTGDRIAAGEVQGRNNQDIQSCRNKIHDFPFPSTRRVSVVRAEVEHAFKRNL